MVAETRAVMLDLAARAVFAEDGEEVRETRSLLSDEWDETDDAVVDNITFDVPLPAAQRRALSEQVALEVADFG